MELPKLKGKTILGKTIARLWRWFWRVLLREQERPKALLRTLHFTSTPNTARASL